LITLNKASLFDPEQLVSVYTYPDYIALIESLVKEGKTTGPSQTEALAHYTKLNLARMQRLNKTVQIKKSLEETIKSIQSPQKWYVLTEAWCGDAAQSIPVIAKLAELNPQITLQLLLRDDNPEVMDQYLTNGGRSIPKLIVLDADDNEIFNWGPRPAGAQAVFNEFKKEPGRPFAELAEAIQKWYNSDKTYSIQDEIGEGLKKTSRLP